MANPISLSELTLNPKETQSVSEFIKELVVSNPEISSLFKVMTVKMKQQLTLVAGLKKTGRKASSDCSRVSSGAQSTLTQKYAEPEKIEDFWEICAAEWSSLWKPYFDKVTEYRELYNIEGSDVAVMIADMVRESIIDAIYRLSWFGDTDAAQSTSSTAGLIDDDDIPAYTPIDGFFKQIFAGVTAGTINKYDLSSYQSTATVDKDVAYAAFMGVYKNADAAVRADKNAKFYCTDQIGLGLMEYMTKNSINFELGTTENGWNTFKFLGHDVVVVPAFDACIKDFEADSTNHGAYLQHRIVFTLPSNLVIATLDEEGIENLEVFFEQKERKLAIAYGFTLDAVMLDGKYVSVAY